MIFINLLKFLEISITTSQQTVVNYDVIFYDLFSFIPVIYMHHMFHTYMYKYIIIYIYIYIHIYII